MAASHEDRLCNGIPVDHRLIPFLQRIRLTQTNLYANHAHKVEEYGSSMLREDYSRPTKEEIEFTKWMAKPDNQGGVLIAIKQPAISQRYYAEDHYRTMDECASLAYLNEAINFIVGTGGISTVSVFDAFPYITKIVKDREKLSSSANSAYTTFLHMVELKRPAVVFGGWNMRETTVEPYYSSTGVGAENMHSQIELSDGYRINVVNGFHPRYAANFIPYESCFRRLFTLELTKAFSIANNSWSEQPWMSGLRAKCKRRVKELIERENHYSQTTLILKLTDYRGFTVVDRGK
jgi:hypothetical protein